MRTNWRRPLIGLLVAGACLLSGPCGITTLQARDFLTSSLIRTGVSTVFTVLEAAIVESAQGGV